MNVPKVSVVVATYRRFDELKRALDSLSAQSYGDYEVVLVDDNADEAWNNIVEELVKEFQSKNSDICLKYIKLEDNLGSAKARNVGIDAATGEFVTFLDDDDLYLPKKIEKQVAFMLDKNADYCVTDLCLFNDKDRMIENKTRQYIKSYSVEDLKKYHLMYHITGTDTMMFRRAYLQRIGGFEPIDVGDEFYLMYKAIENGGQFAYMPGCDVKAYVHTGEGGLSSGQGKIDGENRLYEFKKEHFFELDRRNIRHIRMRHYAVLAFAGLRSRQAGIVVKNGFLCFITSPIGCLKLCLERKF